MGRADIAMIRQAIREGWEVPRQTRQRVPDELIGLLPTASPRQAITIARVFIAMDEQNLGAENALGASLRASGTPGESQQVLTAPNRQRLA